MTRNQNRKYAAQRRVKKRDSLRNLAEKLRLIGIVLSIVSIIAGAYLLFDKTDRPLTRVIIDGEFNHLHRQDLMELVNSEMEGGFLTLRLNDLRKALQSHPWIHQVRIKRQWPSILHVSVLEEMPIARWGEEGFLNRVGERLTIEDNSQLVHLPLLTADFGDSKEMIRQYWLLAELLLPTGLKLTRLQRDALGAWRVATTSGIEILLGRDQLGEKMRRLSMVWEFGLKHQFDNIETIDLRYSNGLSVALRDGLSKDTLQRKSTKVTAIQEQWPVVEEWV